MLLQTHSKTKNIAIYCAVLLAIAATLYRLYLQYAMPYDVSAGAVYDLSVDSRRYQLICNLLLIGSFLLPGIYLAWKNDKFRMKFPGYELLHLVFINLILIK